MKERGEAVILAGQNLYRVEYKMLQTDGVYEKLMVANTSSEAFLLFGAMASILSVTEIEKDISLVIPDKYLNPAPEEKK